MDLSIIIVSWNTRECLSACLESIQKHIKDLSYEVILVDNASKDGTVEHVRDQFPAVRVIANSDNAGFCKGNNQGIEIASGDFIVLLNPDTEVYENSMELLVDFLRKNPEAGVAGPMLLSPNGHYAPNGTFRPTLRRELLGVTGLHMFRKAEYDMEGYGRDDFSKTWEVDVVCGACMLARREVVDQIGGLDEQLFMFFEEVDWCVRAKEAGWKVFYVPESKVLHLWMQSVKQDYIGATKRMFRSQFLYFRKHHGLPAALLLRIISYWTVTYRAARITAVRIRDRYLRKPKSA